MCLNCGRGIFFKIAKLMNCKWTLEERILNLYNSTVLLKHLCGVKVYWNLLNAHHLEMSVLKVHRLTNTFWINCERSSLALRKVSWSKLHKLDPHLGGSVIIRVIMIESYRRYLKRRLPLCMADFFCKYVWNEFCKHM